MSNTITTRRGPYGRLVMSYEGFNYLLDRQRCYKKYWQCAESNCNWRAVTYRNQFEQLTSSHTCKRKKVINKPRVINFDDLSDVGGPGTSNQMAFCTKINEHDTGMVLLTGNSHPELANLLAEKRGISLYDATVINKANKETAFDIRQSVRGKHVFILQTANKNVNNNVMEMLIWIYACKTSIAKTITVVLPYMPYSKQCRMFRLSSLLMKLVADMICKAGASCVVSLDLYFKEIQGFFGIPVDNLRASPFLLHYILGNIPDYKDAVIVAKNTGVMNKATSYIDRLKLGIAVIHGEQKVEGERGRKDGRQSPPTASLGVTYEFLPPNIPKDKPPLTIVGDVSNKIVIIVDDIIDDAFSFVAVAEVLKARGAKKIYVVATHWLLSHDAPSLLEASPIDEV